MEIRPVKEVKLPKYPRMSEVSPESIKEAMPRRWSANRAAKAAFAALAVPALAGYAPDSKTKGTEFFSVDAGNISITADGRDLAAADVGNTTHEAVMPEAYIDPSTVTPPLIQIIPLFVAAGAAALGIGIWIRRIIRKRRRRLLGDWKEQPAESKIEQEHGEGNIN